MRADGKTVIIESDMRLLARSFIVLLMVSICPWDGRSDAPPPYYDDIVKVMAPLEYSGIPIMLKSQVTLGVNFQQRTWTLRNVHNYDGQGNIILDQGHFGLCAELATFLFEKIKPLLDDRYAVKFAMVSESGFFSDAQSNHIVLLVVDKASKQFYLLDPSFHKYARLQDLPEYHVLNIQDTLSFVRDKSHDVSFDVDQATPLYIKDDFLLSFAVTSVDGKFDKANFIFVISANRRYKFSGKDIFLVGRHNNEFEEFQDKALLDRLLGPDAMSILSYRFRKWMEGIPG